MIFLVRSIVLRCRLSVLARWLACRRLVRRKDWSGADAEQAQLQGLVAPQILAFQRWALDHDLITRVVDVDELEDPWFRQAALAGGSAEDTR